MHTRYLTPALRRLRDQHLRSGSAETKLEQIDRADALIAELEAQRRYQYRNLCSRLGTARPPVHLDQAVLGRKLIHDLCLLIEDLSDSIGLAATDAGQRVLTVEELSRQFNVSTKTISRWRLQGLVGRRFVFDGRKRVGFLETSVARFTARNERRVARGRRFSQLTDQERQDIIDRARRLAKTGARPARVARQVAQATGRSAETVRYTVKHYDATHPDRAIFPNRGPLGKETKQLIYQLYRRGEAVAVLAKRFSRSTKVIHRIVNEIHCQQILALPLEYVPNEQFAQALRSPKLDKEFLQPTPGDNENARQTVPRDLPPYLAALYEVPLLTPEQEAHLFRKMNYLKFKTAQLRETLDPARPRRRLMEQIEKTYQESAVIKNHIIRANLRLVVSIARRQVSVGNNILERISDGNISLIRAVERFDFARGNKFSTYASWAITKNYARSVPAELHHHSRFRTSSNELLVDAEDARVDHHEMEAAHSRRKAQLDTILRHLDQREREIIASRYGLVRGQEPLTLQEIGATIGVTKERIRQIEIRALRKLRKAAEGIQAFDSELALTSG